MAESGLAFLPVARTPGVFIWTRSRILILRKRRLESTNEKKIDFKNIYAKKNKWPWELVAASLLELAIFFTIYFLIL